MALPNSPQRGRGFSLLEMVVAIAILGISLSALYQAAGGATRIVSVDEKMAYAVELARSLVVDYSSVPIDGLRRQGSTSSGFEWQVVAQPVVQPEESPLLDGHLQSLEVQVRWPDGDKERSFVLSSVVAGTESGE